MGNSSKRQAPLGGGSRHTDWMSKTADIGTMSFGWEAERSRGCSQDWVEARSNGHEARGTPKSAFPSQFHLR